MTLSYILLVLAKHDVLPLFSLISPDFSMKVLLLPSINSRLVMEDRLVLDLAPLITGQWLINTREERRSGENFYSIILSTMVMEKWHL